MKTQHWTGGSGSSNGSGQQRSLRGSSSAGSSSSGAVSPSGSGEVSLESPTHPLSPGAQYGVYQRKPGGSGQDASGSRMVPCPGTERQFMVARWRHPHRKMWWADRHVARRRLHRQRLLMPDIIMAAASQSGVSPYVLASHDTPGAGQ